MGKQTDSNTTEESSGHKGQAEVDCAPCRGTGKVLRGNVDPLETLPCPWCDGSGKVLAEHDAQARWKT